MFKWILIISLAVDGYFCVKTSPMVLLNKTANLIETHNNNSIESSDVQEGLGLAPNSSNFIRIMDGYTGPSSAPLGTVRFMVCLKRNTAGNCYCGGSLLSQQVVVTAASCNVAVNDYAAMGGVDQTTLPISIRVSKVYNHDFSVLNCNNGRCDNDIAVLILQRPLDEVQDDIEHVCNANLPSSSGKPTSTSVAGYGRNNWIGGTYATSNKLLTAMLQVGSDENCKSTTGYNANKHFCAGNTNTDTCQGDDGGPLYGGNNVLWGIVSHRNTLCNKQQLYTKVSAFNDWIKEKAAEGGAPLTTSRSCGIFCGCPNGASVVSNIGYLTMLIPLMYYMLI